MELTKLKVRTDGQTDRRINEVRALPLEVGENTTKYPYHYCTPEIRLTKSETVVEFSARGGDEIWVRDTVNTNFMEGVLLAHCQH